jgi:hypothetical protein
MPDRIQLSRAKGWRMPENTVKVDRSTRWGNPFRTGIYGTQAECVYAFQRMLSGLIVVSSLKVTPEEQIAYCDHLRATLPALRGKHLACWCKPGTPCHADVLLEIANKETTP